MYEIGIITQFEAAHRLVGDFGPATRMHGHTYRLEVIVRGARLQADGTLFDIAQLQYAVNGLVKQLHYQNLDDVEGLIGTNTTAENVAGFVWEQVAPALRNRSLDTLLVRVWENPHAYAAREDRLA